MQHVRTRRHGRRLAALLAAGSLVISFAAAAGADTIYDTTNGATVDSPIETMNLVAGGSNGTTTLQVQVEGHPDHSGCNLQGTPHNLTMSVSSSDTTIATAAFSGDNVFDTCDEILTVVVTPNNTNKPGQTTISFNGVANTAGDPHITFSFVEATFLVNVTTGTTPPPPVVCDADPAAPAWANAILKANNMKNKTTVQNTISSVAHHMTQGAVFDGIVKNAHPDYENAVYHYLTAAAPNGLGLVLPKNAQQSARPGWECSTQNA